MLSAVGLLLGLAVVVWASLGPRYKVPNPFRKITQETANDFYYFKADQQAAGHEESIEEFFSLGLGLTYSAHYSKDGKSEPWALIVDGRAARSYVLRNPDSVDENEIDCELDHVHSHRHLFPWQYIYDVSQVVSGSETSAASNLPTGLLPELDGVTPKRKRVKRRSRASIYGIGAIWLNLIKDDVQSEAVGDGSPYSALNEWKLEANDLQVEMTFKKVGKKLTDDVATAQSLLDQSAPAALTVRAEVPHKDKSLKRHSDMLKVRAFKAGLREDQEKRLQRFRLQLDLCKKANKGHRQFPNLMRALAGSSDRVYKIDYVAHKYNLYGLGELDGQFSGRHHRYMWPFELVSEVLSLNHNTQSIIYDPSFLLDQAMSKNGERMDMFMARYTENNTRKSARHATAHYHVMVYDEENGSSCKVGEREPKPKLRLLSSSLLFQTVFGTEYPGHVHGLGALLLNAAHLHYKSFSMFSWEIQVPINEDDLNNKRTAMTNVWQVYDARDKIRVLFFIEKRDASREQLSWDLAERDRMDLARLVRVDVREAPEGDETSLAIDQLAVEQDDNLIVQYFIFKLQFELPAREADVFLSVPSECKRNMPANGDANADGDSSDEDDDLDDDANSYDKEFHDDDDDDDKDSSDDEDYQPEDQAGEFEFLTGLEEHGEELPDFVEMLAEHTSYHFVTRIELVDGDDAKAAGQRRKSIWLAEAMDLASERLLLKIYLTRESLAKDEPAEQYFIVYESELIFQITSDKRCVRSLQDGSALPTKWLRLLSGRLIYYVALASHGHKLNDQDLGQNDLVVESNRLSSYGLGALWRRASESGLAEFLGARRERVARDGRTYKQLVWAYKESEMTFQMNFLLEERASRSGRARNRPQLESVLITNQYGEDFVSNFKQVRAVVEHLEVGNAKLAAVPEVCADQLIEAQRMIEHGETIRPPSIEDVLGISSEYELQYSVYPLRGDPDESGTTVRESFDRTSNRGKFVFDEEDANKKLEIFVDGGARRMFAMSEMLGKCTIITELSPTFNSLLSTLVFDNKEFDANRMHGLLGMWQMLAKREAKLRVRQTYNIAGQLVEEQAFSIDLAEPNADGGASKKERHQEIKLNFDKSQPVDYAGSSSFNHADKARIRQRDQLRLRWILFRPIRNRVKQAREKSYGYSASVIVSKQLTSLSDEWRLPQACKDLVANQPDGANSGYGSDSDYQPISPDDHETPNAGLEFPKLSQLFYRTSRFHMRAEVTVKGAQDRVYLVDELYNGGDVRLRTKGLGKAAEGNCDLIMFMDTLNQFDLSTPLRCGRLLEDKAARCLHTSLFDVWMQRMFRVGSLAVLQYGPMTLWQLAEKSSPSAKLIKTIEISPGKSGSGSLQSYKDYLEREMNREVWLISAKGANQPGEWSYMMEFVKHQKPLIGPGGVQTGLNEWHVLESITASDSRDGLQFTVFIDVVNYNYSPDSGLFRRLFLLPEGWNCRRTLADQIDKRFELDLDPGANVQLSYEASLDLLEGDERAFYDEDENVERAPNRLQLREGQTGGSLPTLVGSFVTGGDLSGFSMMNTSNGLEELPETEKRFDLSVNLALTRFDDGRVTSRRIVIDRQMPLEYSLDTLSGSCSVRAAQNPGWRLDFPSADGKKVHGVRMYSVGDLGQLTEHDLFKQLFLDNFDKAGRRQFFLLNKFAEPGETVQTLHASYEREFDILRLTNDLVGPARVVRKYEQLIVTELTRADNFRRVHYMTARAYLLSQERDKVRAVLTVRLQVNPPANLSQFLALANVADCFNEVDALTQRRLASFVLEYPLPEQFRLETGHSLSPWLKEAFYANLLRSKGSASHLLPLQLDGRARLEFSQHDRLLRVHFDVLEAPTSSVYFSQRFQCTMNERMEAVSESRILSSAAACSRWCDQVSCVAMSYCEDRQCRVVTKVAIFGSAKQYRAKSQVEKAADQVSLAACNAHETCTYYFNKYGVRPRTLQGLRDHFDRVVNFKSNAAQLRALSLSLNMESTSFLQDHSQVDPVRFYEAEEVFQWQNEDFEDPFREDLSEEGPAESPAFSGGSLHAAAGRFIQWRALSEFDANKIDQLNEELGQSHNSKFIMTWAVASGQAACLQECQRNQCLLVTACRQQSRCQMIVPTGTKSVMELERLKRELVIPKSADCSISIRDHRDKFQLFAGTQKPKKSWRQLEGYSPVECAAACQLTAGECLAFDACSTTTANGNVELDCFLQRDHVTQDSFDRMVLLPSWDGETDLRSARSRKSGQTDCDHYSKSVVAEFRRVPNAKLKELHGSTLRGVSVDKCAADCLQDDTCKAFEHCLNARRTPTQSCYLIRAAEDSDAQDWLSDLAGERSSSTYVGELGAMKAINKQFVLSRSCSVYVAKTALTRKRLEETLSTWGPDRRFSRARIVTVLVYLLLAALGGLLVQVAYIRLSGRPLSLRSR